MSLLTGLKAAEPKTSINALAVLILRAVLHQVHIPNKVVRLSAASRNWLVSMALSFVASTETSLKDLLTVAK